MSEFKVFNELVRFGDRRSMAWRHADVVYRLVASESGGHSARKKIKGWRREASTDGKWHRLLVMKYWGDVGTIAFYACGAKAHAAGRDTLRLDSNPEPSGRCLRCLSQKKKPTVKHWGYLMERLGQLSPPADLVERRCVGKTEVR